MGDIQLLMNIRVILCIVLNNAVDYSQSGIMIYTSTLMLLYIYNFS